MAVEYNWQGLVNVLSKVMFLHLHLLKSLDLHGCDLLDLMLSTAVLTQGPKATNY